MCAQVRLRVPEISVAMDAKEFEILQDVAAHLAGEQVHCNSTFTILFYKIAIYCWNASAARLKDR